MDETQPTQPDSQPAPDGQSAPTLPVPVGQSKAASSETGETSSDQPEQVTENKSEIEKTIASPVIKEIGSPPAGEPPAGLPAGKTPRKRPAWFLWTILGLLGLLVVAALSAWSGYNSGISLRMGAQGTQVVAQLDEQYNLALQDMDAKRYDLARQRFEYIIRQDPSYPNVTDKLASTLLELNTTATPTLAPTPTLTPTPDTRNQDELFSQAQQSMQNSDWDTTIDTLLNLRKAEPQFHTVEVDDMLFLSLRNRGVDKILKKGDLEGGIYDLSLAERFGPLDTEAESYLTWARIYITGASFWEINWQQVIYYFSQVAPALPNLRDGSGMTATERYRQALIGYAEQLAQSDDWCGAQEQYQASLTLGTDAKVEEALNEAANKCAGPAEDNQGQNDNHPPTVEPQPTQEQPTAEEPAPTEEATPAPVDTPEPTAYPGP